ncbi:glycosyltransferase family 2 protein [Piscinibacter sp.]|jgi:glycosyltransferase involved in cell wall biosynthesis|uniref:glycosyltransferase family 2 protein n=1 Tax=Piscinibacter sp. TaxID=1903157 RepID=UPI00355AA075
MSSVTLSVIVITRNEAHNIAGCLGSVAFADEWVVVDSGSTDGTREIAQQFGARVVATDDWPGFGAQKNRALAQARGRWVLSIDADERVSDELAQSIRRAVAADTSGQQAHASTQQGGAQPVGYELSRLSSFCGQWMRHGDWYPDRVLRLFRREAGRFSNDMVHERLIVDGPTARLSGELLHDTMPTLDDAIDKMNRYTSGRALDKVRAGKAGGLASALSHAAWAFVRCYFLHRGFLDGRLGFVLAVYVAEGTYYRYLKMGLLANAAAVNQAVNSGS